MKTEPKFDTIIYHASCSDGWTAAWVALRSGQCDGAALYAAHYGGDVPPVAGKKVLIVDFSFKRPVMKEILASAASCVVLDHHGTAEKELAGLEAEAGGEITFDMTKSGARLAWEYFHPGKNHPFLVGYVEDRDLRGPEGGILPQTREVNAAIRSHPMTLEAWDGLHGMLQMPFRDKIIAEGRGILRYQSQVVSDHVKLARVEEVAGHKVSCINATTLISEIAGELAKGWPFGVCWFRTAQGKFVFSLRSAADGLDVSEVAKTMGGGGHPHAAGFTVEKLPWTTST